MLDIRKLRALREVALRQSFSDAAVGLGYTQSAISQQIAQLEREAGTSLIDRRGRTLCLTQAGRALVDCADAIMRRLVDAEAELETITGTRQGDLRLAVMPDAVATWLPDAVGRFRCRHPSVPIALTVPCAATTVGSVDTNEVDICVVEWRDTMSLPPNVAAVPLFDDPVRVLLPQGHHALGAPSDVRALLDDTWILPSAPSVVTDVFHELCRRENVRPRVGAPVDDVLAVHGMVAAGLGIALLPASTAELAIRDDVVAVPVDRPEPIRRVVALVRSGIERSPAVAGMLAELRGATGCFQERVPTRVEPAGHYDFLSGDPAPGQAWTARRSAG